MPYRLDLADPPDDALDRLLAFGALDIETVAGGVAVLLPDGVPPGAVASSLGARAVAVSPGVARDDGSTWVLTPRPFRAAGLTIVPADQPAPAGALRLVDGPAFGTGLHPSTALCLEALDGILRAGPPASLLDVGTGSGILALAALLRGVPEAVGLDVDPAAVRAAGENAHLNGLDHRLRLVPGDATAVEGAWPVVLANIAAAPLIEMAPILVRRLASRGRLVLAGVHDGVSADVVRAYRTAGLHHRGTECRAGWAALRFDAGW